MIDRQEAGCDGDSLHEEPATHSLPVSHEKLRHHYLMAMAKSQSAGNACRHHCLILGAGTRASPGCRLNFIHGGEGRILCLI